jgi:hypothetical protein
MNLLWFIVLWFLPVPLTYAIFFAHLQRNFPSIAQEEYQEDMSFSLFLALVFSWIGLFVAFFATGFAKHGLKFR